MIELEKKYVFHIPLFRHDDGKLTEIDIDGPLDDLIARFDENGFDSLYATRARSHYKSRCFDELLLTLFVSSSENPEEIFRKWFEMNNDVLGQEALGWECGNRLFVVKL
ncbi:hypothetical protein [Methanobrevibacter sp.]|uniref:hypothetical protein n=1 Tax=Methanobrevibacter sp. TaxID=66852 RepID=UPI0038908221